MNPMQAYYAAALRAQRQEQQPTAMGALPPQQQAEQLYSHLVRAGVDHDTALNQATAHFQRLHQQQAQQTQPAGPARGDDFLTNNNNLQGQGHGSGGGQYPDGVAHD
jgi:hypothetical protein